MRLADLTLGHAGDPPRARVRRGFRPVHAQPRPHPRHPVRARDRTSRPLGAPRRAGVRLLPRRGLGRRVRPGASCSRSCCRTRCRSCSRARSLVAADAIFVEASLSFVGLGVQPPAASWGTLLHIGYTNLYTLVLVPDLPGPRDRDRGARAERARRQPPAGRSTRRADERRRAADARRARRPRSSRSSSRASARGDARCATCPSPSRSASSSGSSASPAPGSR